MIQKSAKPAIFKRFQGGLKIFLFVETIAFFGSYGVWFRMNRDQAFRGYIGEKFPSILEGFYRIGEIFDKDALARLREADSATFAVKKSK
ncbi:uncharacterized protein LOC116337115 [Contarinia nasturtii]|uniref:uncharacterized protein LOC116337115 n=1 Tax=Contarinia nasturtii TaxID=265458 RepID=UPI0012D3F6D5|nr:uncharacterized protein LOC116337115 [Contarinia nasturtii]